MEVPPMTISTPIADVTVRRAPGSAPLITAADLPPARHFVHGTFDDAAAGPLIDWTDPCTENLITQPPAGTTDDVDRAVAAAAAATQGWARLVPKQRSEILHRIADRIADNADLLARLESANTGKPFAVSRDDVSGTVDTFRFMAGALPATTPIAARDYAEGPRSVT